MELSTEVFDYSMTVTPYPGHQLLTSNSSVFLVFSYERNYSDNADCKGGRKIGPIPTVTDER